MRWKVIARDTLIVWCLTFLGGFVIGSAFSFGAIDSLKIPMALAVATSVSGIVAFTIVGAVAKVDRFRHLIVVAIAAWATNSLVNVLLLGRSVGRRLLTLPFITAVMLIGGGYRFF